MRKPSAHAVVGLAATLVARSHSLEPKSTLLENRFLAIYPTSLEIGEMLFKTLGRISSQCKHHCRH
jgi:hypothetical protein